MARRNETLEQYLARREREELVLAISAPDNTARDAHYALAKSYRDRLAATGGEKDD